ncbi:hypothetical protein ACJJIK_13535 [Microbulbifer sp. ZKSA006]|uniref:hypothetical protein n=1 Tax=Microbulbifer sp. ZKSA006 TaxID=3243390 RepID=UPI0040394DA8
MDIESLIENLRTHSPDQLNEILDLRDEPSFDEAWVEANELVGGTETFNSEQSCFSQLLGVTGQHEVCSYILDDLNLLYRARTKNINTPFIQYLKGCYEQGAVPHQWPS